MYNNVISAIKERNTSANGLAATVRSTVLGLVILNVLICDMRKWGPIKASSWGVAKKSHCLAGQGGKWFRMDRSSHCKSDTAGLFGRIAPATCAGNP